MKVFYNIDIFHTIRFHQINTHLCFISDQNVIVVTIQISEPCDNVLFDGVYLDFGSECIRTMDNYFKREYFCFEGIHSSLYSLFG